MTSIIIPAFNEGLTIERCLATILEDAGPKEFEIVVVCNNCKDDTASRARKFVDQGVVVLETPIGSKCNAMNLGDDAATSFPRLYVDADILLSADAVREVAALLAPDSQYVVAAPRGVVDFKNRGPLVRSFYRVWTQMPYFKKCLIGGGVFAFSEEGRARFGRFPELLSDDEFVRLHARPAERAITETSTFVVTPPGSILGVLKIFTRYKTGNYELLERYPELQRNNDLSRGSSLKELYDNPNLWPDAPLYLGVMCLAQLRAKRRHLMRTKKVWSRDEATRKIFGSGSSR